MTKNYNIPSALKSCTISGSKWDIKRIITLVEWIFSRVTIVV